MTLRQRLCGFRGHDSFVSVAHSPGQAYIRLTCVCCEYRTKWFNVWELQRRPGMRNPNSESKE